jgi:RNA polymerase sigma-70 factor (ECF subfamily)
MRTERWGGASFDALYRDSFAVVVQSVRWIVGDAEVAREITQDAFVAALVHWRKVSSYDNPGAWVRRVAVRQAVRAANRARTQPAFPMAAAASDGDLELDVRAAIAELPAAQRAAVVLRYMHDLPVAEVARTLGCAEGTAKTHLFRARKALAARLGEEDE